MWKWVDDILANFRNCFTRAGAHCWFEVLVIGLLIRDEQEGVTSIVRSLSLAPCVYETMNHFFRSTAWSLERLQSKWAECVRDSHLLFLEEGMPVLVGDGVKQPKEGNHMPCVKRLHQESGNSSKPEYINGHMFGAIGVLTGNETKVFCTPLSMTLQDGDELIRKWENPQYPASSHAVRIMRDAIAAANILGRSFLLLDAYFLSAPLLEEMAAGAGLVTLVTRAKSSIVAYAPPPPYSGRGRPRKKGEAVKLNTLFASCAEEFVQADICLYGKMKSVRYLCRDLLWGATLYTPLRFILVEYEATGARTILVCSDQNLSPESIIRLYGRRFKIETTFRALKQSVGGLSYHFWSSAIPKRNRYAKKGDTGELSAVADPAKRARIIAALKATEGYVMLCLIATGLLQMGSLFFTRTLEQEQIRWLRTRSNDYLSEATMQEALRRSFFKVCFSMPHLGIVRLILPLGVGKAASSTFGRVA